MGLDAGLGHDKLAAKKAAYLSVCSPRAGVSFNYRLLREIKKSERPWLYRCAFDNLTFGLLNAGYTEISLGLMSRQALRRPSLDLDRFQLSRRIEAVCLIKLGDFKRGLRIFEDLLNLYARVEPHGHLAGLHLDLGEARLMQGRYDLAKRKVLEAAAIYEFLGAHYQAKISRALLTTH